MPWHYAQAHGQLQIINLPFLDIHPHTYITRRILYNIHTLHIPRIQNLVKAATECGRNHKNTNTEKIYIYI